MTQIDLEPEDYQVNGSKPHQEPFWRFVLSNVLWGVAWAPFIALFMYVSYLTGVIH